MAVGLLDEQDRDPRRRRPVASTPTENGRVTNHQARRSLSAASEQRVLHAVQRTMRPVTTPLRDLAAWQALEKHHAAMARTAPARPLRRRPGPRRADGGRGGGRLPRLLEAPRRRRRRSACSLRLAEESGLRERIDAMFAGEHINVTEDRAVLHVALRARRPSVAVTRGPRCTTVLDRMRAFSEQVRSGEWKGYTGKSITRRGQHRHRRLRSRPGDGVRGARAVLASATCASTSSRTSTATTSPRRLRDLDPSARCSSSRRRRSRRRRR